MISALDGQQSVKKQFAHLVNPQKESAPLKEENGRVKVCLLHREDNLWVRTKKATNDDRLQGLSENYQHHQSLGPINKFQLSTIEAIKTEQSLRFWNGVSHIIDLANINSDGNEWYYFEGCLVTINGQHRVSNNQGLGIN